jgi:hypothetical protein
MRVDGAEKLVGGTEHEPAEDDCKPAHHRIDPIRQPAIGLFGDPERSRYA